MKETGTRAQKPLASSPRIVELKKKRKKNVRIKLLLWSFLILLLLIGIGLLSRWSEINIKSIAVYGNKIIDTAVVQNAVNEELDGYYLWVIPKRNFVVLPRKKIQERLKNDFKRFEEVDISVKDATILDITVKERKALYTWCGESLEFYKAVVSLADEGSKNCYFTNESGYIFDKAPYFSGGVYFKFFGSLTGDGESALGKSYFQEYFGNMVEFVEGVKSFGLRPHALIVKEDGDIEMYLKAEVFDENANKIIFTRDGDMAKALDNLHASLSTEPLKSELAKRYEELLYIDLRFGNKVYYKFK